MPQEHGHLHLFPTEFPKDQAMIVINGLRGIDDGKSRRDRIEAVWWVIGAGLSMIPDQHPPMGSSPMSADQAADVLKAAADDPSIWDRPEGMKSAGGVGGLPWNLLLPILIQLLQKWLS